MIRALRFLQVSPDPVVYIVSMVKVYTTVSQTFRPPARQLRAQMDDWRCAVSTTEHSGGGNEFHIENKREQPPHDFDLVVRSPDHRFQN